MPSLLDKSFQYHNEASHGFPATDPRSFAARMQARKVAAQNREQWAQTGHNSQWLNPSGPVGRPGPLK